MSSPRDAILARIRGSLGAKANDPVRLAAAQAHIESHGRHLIPARADLGPDEKLLQFQRYLEGQLASIATVADRAGIPAAVAALLQRHGAPQRLRCGTDPRLDGLDWAKAGLQANAGAAEADDSAGLSYALSGIAETGTLVMGSGADNPVTLAFVPAIHFIVVDRSDIVGSYEEALEQLRARYGPSGMPRTVNYISGPSRTADIGGKIVIGAHGPRQLGIIIVG